MKVNNAQKLGELVKRIFSRKIVEGNFVAALVYSGVQIVEIIG